MLGAARGLLALRDPLDAEIVVSEILGAWWGQRPRGDNAERIFGEGLIAYASAEGTPAAATLLHALAGLGRTRRQRLDAKAAAAALVDRGVACPPWVSALPTLQPRECYLSGSRFGDADDVICVFDYLAPGGEEERTGRHALIAVVDYNAGGILRDAWVTTKVEALIEHCRAGARADRMSTFVALAPERARSLLRSASARTESALPPGSGGRTALLPVRAESGVPDPGAGSLATSHALLRARVRALPGHGAPTRNTVWLREHRATLVARFLSSSEAEELSDSFVASRCADHIVDYGCDVDAGRPMRISPRKAEAFLLTWLPSRVALSPAEQEAVPHILAAWVRWAGRRTGLPENAIASTLDSVWGVTNSFTDSYPDHAAGGYGLPRDVVNRLIPDGDLAALPRRMFAFPLLASDVIPDKEHYDPGTVEGRRALLRLDHFDGQQPSQGKHASNSFEGSPELEEALDVHEMLALRLWDGNPPNLWSAAQRLLDRGMTRVTVISTLCDMLERTVGAGSPTSVLVKRLDDL